MATIDRAISFPTAKRGYDAASVDGHLDHLDTTHQIELKALRAEVTTLQSALAEAKMREEAVHLTLVAATKTRDEMVAGAQAKVDEATATATAAAEAVLNDGKFEAFRLVTDARTDADTILAEARSRAEEALPEARAHAEQLVADAQRQAEEVRDAAHRDAETTTGTARSEAEAFTATARTEAIEILREAQADAVTLTEEKDLELQRLRDELVEQRSQLEERVAALWAEAETLDARIEAARTVADDLPEPPAASFTKTRYVSTAVEPIEPTTAGRTVLHDDAAPASAASAVAPDVGDPEVREPAVVASPAADGAAEAADVIPAGAEDEAVVAPTRGSFYSRRSAKLPRIGEDAGRDALAAMSGLRSQIIAEDEEREEGDREEDLATQTA